MTDDVELGYVVDLTLGEPSGTELVADAAIGATTLTVDYAGDFEDAGEVVLNGVTLAYTSIAYGDAEADPDIITLAAPLEAAAVTDDKVVRVSGGEPLSDWLLHVSLGDGHPVDIPIPFEQRALWSGVDVSTPVPVMVSADLEQLVEVPGRTPTIDGSFIDPTSTIPGGQAFSLDAPTATDGYPEDYGWWQVDASNNVLGFWRLVGGVWTAQAIVTAEALKVGNVLADAINASDLTAVTITGAVVRTSASGQRVQMSSLDYVQFYSGSGSEQLPGYVEADVSGDFARLIIAAPDTDTSAKGTTTYRNMILMYEDVTDASVNRTSRTVTVRTAHFYIETADGDYIHIDGSGGTPQIDLAGGVLYNLTMGNGSVGVNTFRDSVDARADARSAARMQAGTVSSGTMVAATVKQVAVTYPTAFSSAPKVVVSEVIDPASTIDRRAWVVPGSETTTGFTAAFLRATGTGTFDANWIAVKP